MDDLALKRVGHSPRASRCGWSPESLPHPAEQMPRASSLILPAPTRKTVRPWSDPKILRASSTATEAMETDLSRFRSRSELSWRRQRRSATSVSSWPPTVPEARATAKASFTCRESAALHHHRIQAGGHAEEMPHGLLVLMLIEVRTRSAGVKPEVRCRKLVRPSEGESALDESTAAESLRGCSGHNHALGHPGTAARARVASADPRARWRSAHAPQWRGLVVDAMSDRVITGHTCESG